MFTIRVSRRTHEFKLCPSCTSCSLPARDSKGEGARDQVQKVQPERTDGRSRRHSSIASVARAHADHYIPVSNPRGGSEESRPRLRPLTISRSRIVAQLRSEKRTSSLPLSASPRPSHLPRAIAYHFSQKKPPVERRRRRRRGGTTGAATAVAVTPGAVSPRTRTHRSRVSLFLLSSPTWVQYPWMSVDLVTRINVKRGLNSNPSRAAGRAIGNCPSHLGRPRSLQIPSPDGDVVLVLICISEH